jgi:hypothetical protein
MEGLSKNVPKLSAKKSFFLHFRSFSIDITPALIDFEERIEVGIIILNTVILHPRGD